MSGVLPAAPQIVHALPGRIRVHLPDWSVVGVDLPDLPGEDRPAHPLDPAPLIQSATRSAGAFLGLSVLAVRRMTGLAAPASAVRKAAAAAGVIGLLRSFPIVRNGLRRLL